MEGVLDLPEASENVSRPQDAFESLPWNAAQPIPVREEVAIETPLTLRGYEVGVVSLVQQIVDAFFVDREVFFTDLGRGDQLRVQAFDSLVQAPVNRNYI